MKRELLRQNHDDFHAEHFDYDKICDLIRQKYWWSNMPKNIRKYVIICIKCAQIKFIRHKFYELLKFLFVSKIFRQD